MDNFRNIGIIPVNRSVNKRKTEKYYTVNQSETGRFSSNLAASVRKQKAYYQLNVSVYFSLLVLSYNAILNSNHHLFLLKLVNLRQKVLYFNFYEGTTALFRVI